MLKEEAEVREREAEELRLAEGAFPALSNSGPGSGPGSGGVGAGAGTGGAGGFGGGRRSGALGPGLGRRVLLVDSRTKRVKVESYSRTDLENEEEDLGEAEVGEAGIDERVPPPAREVECVRVQRGPATRWVDLKGDGTVKYVAPLSAA